VLEVEDALMEEEREVFESETELPEGSEAVVIVVVCVPDPPSKRR
jgi:hypothetical protein